MTVQHRTDLNQIEITEDSRLQIRFALVLFDGETVYSRDWHRTAVEQGGDIDAQVAIVNVHLAEMGRAAVPTEAVTRIKAVAAAVWA